MEFISYVLLTYSQKLLSYKKERRSNEKGVNDIFTLSKMC